MSGGPAGLAARVRAALAAPGDGPLAARFAAPFVTALVADAREGDAPATALGEVMAALERAGVPRGRQFVLLGGDPVVAGARSRARTLRAALGVPVFAHEPARAGFVAGRLDDGTPIELDDELREAEAIVTVGRAVASSDGPLGGPALLVPGVSGAGTRAAYARARAASGAAAWAFTLAAEERAPVDLAVWWDERGRVRAASGRSLGRALAREAGVP